MNHIDEYLSEIRAGKIVVNRRVKAIYERLSEDIKNPGKWIFDEVKAERPIKFIERFCRHSKGQFAGDTFTLALWQKALISAVFGFIDANTGARRFKEVFLGVGRKNGKTTLAAAIALYMTIIDEVGANTYCVASKYAQARLCFDEALNMVKQSPELASIAKKRKTDLYFPQTFSSFQPLASKSDTLDGLSGSCIILDELHSYKDGNLYSVMSQSMSARKQGLLLMVTTSGFIRGGIYDNLHKYACDVADGTIEDDRFLPLLYELDNRDEWIKPEAWEKANPNMGISKSHDYIIEKVQRARANPYEISTLLCKDFCIPTTGENAWLNFSDIENPETFNIEDLRGCVFVGGADLSLSQDLTAACAVVLGKDNKKYVLCQAFLPQDNFYQRVHEEKIPYDVWNAAGYLTLTPGNVVNPEYITEWFKDLVLVHGLVPHTIGYDPYASSYWSKEMTTAGFYMEVVRQGALTMSQPLRALASDLAAKRINYNDNPMLKWCLSNCSVVEDRNCNISLVKKSTPKYRIDLAAALADAYVILDRYMDELKVLAERR